VDLRSGK
jgi:hypothetical protein